MDIEVARDLRDHCIRSLARWDRLVLLVERRCSQVEFEVHRHRIGKVMGEICASALEPLVAEHPDLDPSEEEWKRIAGRALAKDEKDEVGG